MNRVVTALALRLSFGTEAVDHNDYSHGFVETLAKAYEKARNALEYRADNLVRRAAIERILKRLTLLYKNPDTVAENLLTELKWARYLDRNQAKGSKKAELSKILSKYILYSGSIPHEWIIKIASAEIEEHFDLNKDYSQFTFFAFQAVKQKVDITDENLELLIFFATDKIFAASDPEQIAYHIISLAGKNIDNAKMEEGWKLFNSAQTSKVLPRLNKFVRRVMPPLVLLRDVYFYSPTDFKTLLNNKDKFIAKSSEVLNNQLDQVSGKISTAGIRSIIYVFLTKMVLAFGLEGPLEMLIYGKLTILPLIINLIFPPLLMWITTMQIKTPSTNERDLLVKRSWYIINNFDDLKNEENILSEKKNTDATNTPYIIFSAIYALIFISIFVLIYFGLDLIGFRFFSKLIFIFFLTIIAFFAYRINQIARVYSWREKADNSSLVDMISLPILTIGSILSQGLTKLNFLGFIFDFILEAPFKLILRFVDDWVQFLSAKKEEQLLE